MKKILYLLVLSFLVSCESEEVSKTIDSPNNLVKKEVEKDTIQNKIEKIKATLITNRTATKKLTAYGKENRETKVLIKTNYGNIKIRLYNQTPLHRANFIMLTKKKYFDSTLFYRVIKNFMIQGGNSEDDVSKKMLAIGSYRIENEINPKFAHTRGAIAMAVSVEEQQFGKKSSASNFYIIEGQKLSKKYLKKLEAKGIKITSANKKKYLRVGGAPHLDGKYTVFGEVYEGFRVLTKISKVKTKEGDWPIKKVHIKSIEVIK